VLMQTKDKGLLRLSFWLVLDVRDKVRQQC
jgi:hypothetical protein